MARIYNVTDLIVDTNPQQSEEWFAARRGVITGSNFKKTRDFLKNGNPSTAQLNYAMDVARERAGGRAAPVFVSAPMKIGTAEESNAVREVEIERGYMVTPAGFIHTPDRKFGCSVDGMVDKKGLIEVKTMVSSATLFTAVVKGEIDEYQDQCDGAMWLLDRDWCDLVLWAPDLHAAGLKGLHVVRIERNEAREKALEKDLFQFSMLVDQLHKNLMLKAA